MTTDTRTHDLQATKDLIPTLEDGRKGFTAAADRLAETDRADLAAQFRRFGDQRGEFAAELARLAGAYGESVELDGTVAGAVHRGWMAVKDTISGSSAEGVLDAAEQGEDHALSEYKKALEGDISAELRARLSRQFQEVQQTHDQVRALRDAVS
jgi:uncharacterized protein (TIGR02284 family)